VDSLKQEKMRRLDLVFLLVVFSFLTILSAKFPYWFLHQLAISADQSVYVESGNLILQGKVPYLDFFDFNPPLIMYLNVIPVAVAKLFHWPLPLGLNVTVQCFHIFSTALCAYFVFAFRRTLLAPAFVPMLFAFALYSQGLIADHGQREHLFTLGFMPFFFLRGLRYLKQEEKEIDRRLAILTGALAGLLMSLKPHFALIWLFAELGFLSYAGKFSLRPAGRRLPYLELLALLVPPLVYLVCFFSLPKQALRVFFDLALTVYQYGSLWGAKSFMHSLCGTYYFTEPFNQFLVGAFFFVVLRRRNPWLSGAFMLALAGLFNYLIGGHAWTYRLLPMALYSQLLLALECGTVFNIVYERFKERVPGIALLASLGLFIYSFNYTGEYFTMNERDYEVAKEEGFDLSKIGFSGFNPRVDFDNTFYTIVENTGAHDTVVYMGSGIRPGYPAQLQAGRPPGSVFLYGYPLTMISQARLTKPSLSAVFDRLEAETIERFGKDIAKNKVNLVLVQECPIAELIKPYNFVDKYLSAYSRVCEVDGAQVYKFTGGKVDLTRYSTAARREIVLKVLSGVWSEEQAASEKQVPLPVVRDWVKRGRKALDDGLTDRVLDDKGALLQKMEELYRENWRLNEEIGKLRAP